METATLDMAQKILSVFRDEPKKQVQALLASGLLADVRDADFSKPVDRNAIRRLLGLNPLMSPLEVIGTVVIPATTEPFVPREKLVVNVGADASVKISFLGVNFKEWFFDKTEEVMEEVELRVAELTRSSLDAPILEELGDKTETTLSHVYALMARQANGQEGTLLTNGWANIFYVRDAKGGLRAVYAFWDGSGWFVSADSVEDPAGWSTGHRVSFRNS